jgi:Planctomycete cytochrome C.
MLLLLILLSAGAVSAQTPTGVDFFESRIRPIFTTSCAPCHTAKAHTAGLNLATPEGILHGSDSGPILQKDKPEESKILRAVSYLDRVKMPPTGKLKDEQIADIAAWVKMGAPLPAASAPTAARPPSEKSSPKGRRNSGPSGP